MESPKPRPINREKTLTFFAIFVLILYATLVCIGFVFDFYFHKIWFSLAIFCIGLNLLAKAMFFHLDSDFMLGLLGLTFGAASAVFMFFPNAFMLEIYLGLLAAIFLMVHAIFRQSFYLILFALFALQVLLLIVFKHSAPLVFWLVQGTYFLVVAVFFVYMTKQRKEK